MKNIVALPFLISSCFPISSSQTVDKPLQVSGDVQPPVLVKQVDPKFSRKMRTGEKEQDILVHLTVDEKGSPVNVRVLLRPSDFLTADAEFQTSAVDAVKQYRFRPATSQGVPVAFEMNVDVHFQVIAKR